MNNFEKVKTYPFVPSSLSEPRKPHLDSELKTGFHKLPWQILWVSFAFEKDVNWGPSISSEMKRPKVNFTHLVPRRADRFLLGLFTPSVLDRKRCGEHNEPSADQTLP